MTPSDLDGEVGLATTDDGDDWVDPHTSEAADAIRAVAIDAGVVTHADKLLDDAAWSRAYDRLRRGFDDPVPEYVSREGRAGRCDTVIGAVERARDTVQAAQTACRGGWRIVELLTVHDDGRAYPAAGPLLWALLAPLDSEVSTTHEWHNHELAGDDDPIRISAVDMGPTTMLADRASQFVTVRRPPALKTEATRRAREESD